MTLYRSTVSGRARSEDIAALVGTIDAEVVDKLVATGATLDEIAQALAVVEDSLRFDDHLAVLPSPRVAAVRALLEPLLVGRENNIARGRD